MTVPKKKLTKFFFPFIVKEKINSKLLGKLQEILGNKGKLKVAVIKDENAYFWGTFLGKGYPNLKKTRKQLSEGKFQIVWITPKNGESFLLNYNNFSGKISTLAENNIKLLMPTSIKNWSHMCHFIVERPELFKVDIETVPVK